MTFYDLKQLLLEMRDIPHTVMGKLEADDLHILDVSSDSRAVVKDGLFASFTEHQTNAVKFIAQAINIGVKVIILSEAVYGVLPQEMLSSDVCFIVTSLPRKLFAKVARAFYKEHPANCIAVTGTAGKTSVTNFVMQLWHHLGIPSLSVGTFGIVRPNQTLSYAPSLTTGEIDALHKALFDAKVREGIDHIILEASSHGLDQYRLDGLSFKVAAFTNFSQDHLDYHPTMEEYFAAKVRLFTDLLSEDGIAVLNADIQEVEKLKKICLESNKRVVSYGLKGDLVSLQSVAPQDGCQLLTLSIAGKDYSVAFPLVGNTQVQNVLCAIAILVVMGIDPKKILQGVEVLKAVPGRLERVAEYQGGGIYVDYAHKPGALAEVLKDLKKFCDNKLHLVFGCGGERDKDKRKKMGEIAQRMADFVYVTDDNPRSEPPATIRLDVLGGCAKATEIADRRKAIETAIDQMALGDVLIIAGKGHETYQLYNGLKIDFDDKKVVLNYLDELEKSHALL